MKNKQTKIYTMKKKLEKITEKNVGTTTMEDAKKVRAVIEYIKEYVQYRKERANVMIKDVN